MEFFKVMSQSVCLSVLFSVIYLFVWPCKSFSAMPGIWLGVHGSRFRKGLTGEAIGLGSLGKVLEQRLGEH